jgi:hypothetical protein
MTPPKEMEVEKRAEGNVSTREHRSLPALYIENRSVTTKKVSMAGIQAVNTIAYWNQRHPYSANPHFFPVARRFSALERHRIVWRQVTFSLYETPEFLWRY